MVETLRNKQVRKQTRSTPAKPDDPRGIIAEKLLEGHALHGGACDKCVMPLMSYEGFVSCVVCKKLEETRKATFDTTEEAVSDAKMAFPLRLESEVSEEEKEELINRELFQANERRSRATQVYTSKILVGYTMHDQLCSKCDMPMMKYEDSIECVFCRKEAKEEASEPAQGEVKEGVRSNVDECQAHIEEMVVNKNDTSGNPSEEPKPSLNPVKEPSQAELIAERLKGMHSKDYNDLVDNDLEKTEGELLNIIGNQSGEVSASLQDYFSTKKQNRAASKRLKEIEDAIVGNEIDSILEQRTFDEEDIHEAKRVVVEPAFMDSIPEQRTCEEVCISEVKQAGVELALVGKPIIVIRVDAVENGDTNENGAVPLIPAKFLY
mmetsp:Transcript_16637/g.36130  ORF Transcript_16637/g.36130 Transcript_16637/m.36130 type:complete len:379 (-) Transcript_16637:81-1217(-)